MSEYTHIAGIVRIDLCTKKFTVRNPYWIKDTLMSIFAVLPSDSDGSALAEFRETRAQPSMPWGHVTINGDLRSDECGDIRQIIEWFEGRLALFSEAKLVAIDAVLSVIDDDGDKVVVTLDPNRDPVYGKEPILVERWIKRDKAT